jgi:hypothetical protein
MNTVQPTDHPTEEQLMEFALDGSGVPDIGRHVESCAACATTVAEFRTVCERVASIDEEDIPERVERRVLNIARHGRSRGGPAGIGALLSNPFLIALIVALVVVFLYYLVGSEVFKTP